MLENLSIPIGKVVAGVGSASVVGGGGLLITYGAGGFGDGRPKSTNTSKIQKISPDADREEVEFKNVEEFKNKKGGTCFKHVFVQDSFNDQLKNDSFPANSSDYFGVPATNSRQDDVHGCLSIQTKFWTQTSSGYKKWKGTFSWVWAFKNGTKGFIVFGFAETKEKDKLHVSGAAYFLEHSSSTWSIKNRKTVDANKTIGNSEFLNKFPKKHTGFTFTGNTEEFPNFNSDGCWDWPSSEAMKGGSSGDTTVCDDKILTNILTDLQELSPTGKRYLFTWSSNPSSGAKNKKVSDWCESLEWWKHMFDSGDSFKLKAQLEQFKGAWTYQSTT